jgi:uncharacterized protein YyaL (SSP411 family)
MKRTLVAIVLALLSTVGRADAPKPKGEPADKVLAAGLAAAKKDGKVVFLAFSTPSCGWCEYLDRFHKRPAVAKTLGKHLVFVKVDLRENLGGQKLYDQYAAETAGVPVWVFLSADGKVLADSFAEGKGKKKENVGFPGLPSEIVHYEKALRAALPKLTDDDVAGIIRELKDAGPKKQDEK